MNPFSKFPDRVLIAAAIEFQALVDAIIDEMQRRNVKKRKP